MSSWRHFLRLTVSAAILLIAVLVVPCAAQAHAGHAAGDGAHAGGASAGAFFAEIALDVAGLEWMDVDRDGPPLDRMHGSCGGPCCNVACSAGCVSHALSNAAAALPPAPDVLARLRVTPDALPVDPPERRLPKPPRA